MKRIVEWRPAAWEELGNAAEWYNKRRSGLGVEFVEAARGMALEVAEHPEQGPLIGHKQRYRRRLLKRFPYALIYRITDSAVVILAVAHQRRRPG